MSIAAVVLAPAGADARLLADTVAVVRSAASAHRVLLAAAEPIVDASAAELRVEALTGAVLSLDDALLAALERGLGDDADVLVAVAASGAVDAAALGDAVSRVRRGPEDSVFAVTEVREPLWRIAADGVETAGGEPLYRDAGSFAVVRVPGFRAARRRDFGRVGVVVVERAVVERAVVERAVVERGVGAVRPHKPGAAGDAPHPSASDPARDPATASGIDADAVVTDFGGVPTDDRVILNDDGNDYVVADRADGAGMRMLRDAGVPVLMLSEQVQPVVRARARTTHVDVIHGSDDKAAALAWWAEEHGVELDRVAYLGRDASDLACLALVGWPVSAADAEQCVRDAARVVLDSADGHGAVRELAERMLAARGAERPRTLAAARR